jgi:hypothetical protein
MQLRLAVRAGKELRVVEQRAGVGLSTRGGGVFEAAKIKKKGYNKLLLFTNLPAKHSSSVFAVKNEKPEAWQAAFDYR